MPSGLDIFIFRSTLESHLVIALGGDLINANSLMTNVAYTVISLVTEMAIPNLEMATPNSVPAIPTSNSHTKLINGHTNLRNNHTKPACCFLRPPKN